MTIQQFIEKHALSPVQVEDWRPAMLLMDDDDPHAHFGDVYQFYTNADRTLWVSVNQTAQKFRICFHDLVAIWSDWRSVSMNYELQPM